MNLTSIIPLPYRLIFIAVIFAAAGAFGWFKGYMHGENDLTVYKAQVTQAVADQEKKTADEIAKRDQISQSIAQLYTEQIAKDKEKDREKTSVASHITCTYDGLRDTGPAGSAHLRAVPGASGEPDAATLNALSAGLPEQCRDTTRQLEDLQLEECKQLAVSGEYPDYCKRLSH